MPNPFNRGLLDPNIYGAPAPFGFGAPFGATPSPSAGAGGAPQPGYDPSGNYDQGMPPLQNVDDDTTTWRPGGFTPVPLDVTRPVREGTLKALGQIFKYFRDRDYGNRGGGGGRINKKDEKFCDEDYNSVYRQCREAQGNPDAVRFFGLGDINDCVRRNVDERCGGPKRKDPPPPEIKRYYLGPKDPDDVD